LKLELHQVKLAYGDRNVVDDVSFELDRGRIGCLLGPSGSGKTSLLRAIAGFEPLLAGSIAIDGVVLSSAQTWVPTEQRGVGMVFQDFALLPHLHVAANIAFGLFRLTAHEREARVREMLTLVGLSEQAHSYPHQLSGGMQQRVALARALAPKPRLLLLDEPFASLDAMLRERLCIEVRALLERAATTALMVTHTQSEAFAMADVIGVLDAGRLRQWASPYRLYHEPVDRAVATFIGDGVLLPGTSHEHGVVSTELGDVRVRNGLGMPGSRVDVLLRPDDVVHDDAASIRAVVVRRAFRGAEFMYTLRLPSGQELLSLVPSHHDHALGEAIGIRLDLEHVIVYPC